MNIFSATAAAAAKARAQRRVCALYTFTYSVCFTDRIGAATSGGVGAMRVGRARAQHTHPDSEPSCSDPSCDWLCRSTAGTRNTNFTHGDSPRLIPARSDSPSALRRRRRRTGSRRRSERNLSSEGRMRHDVYELISTARDRNATVGGGDRASGAGARAGAHQAGRGAQHAQPPSGSL
ncbi:hypothetical protein EVAR_80791_1 [Eumeta japonica]|uniref:Uncharacterized protein n=1 Tax=Eumeta variegata TaxID=151549 RepID=A0A4C1WDJ6_EUMVA|nr:hypothetical protein EVAR_80791_1 [Eumeta japonica]